MFALHMTAGIHFKIINTSLLLFRRSLLTILSWALNTNQKDLYERYIMETALGIPFYVLVGGSWFKVGFWPNI